MLNLTCTQLPPSQFTAVYAVLYPSFVLTFIYSGKFCCVQLHIHTCKLPSTTSLSHWSSSTGAFLWGKGFAQGHPSCVKEGDASTALLHSPTQMYPAGAGIKP